MIAIPPVRLTRNNTPLVFDHDCQVDLEEFKNRWMFAPILRHYDPNLKVMLGIEASDGVVAGVRSQPHPDGEWHPVSFFSKATARAECNSEIHDKEYPLSVTMAC